MMKLSDYISALQEIVNNNGDIDCVTYTETDDFNVTEQGQYEMVNEYDILNSIIKRTTRVLSYIGEDDKKEYCSMNMKGYIDGNMEKVFVIEDRY